MLKDGHFMSIADRSILACWGVRGGKAGQPFEVVIDPGGPHEREVDALADAEPVVAGEVIRIRTTGGGGWGNPLERDPALVVRDVVWRKVSPEAALASYGVVLTGSLDDDSLAYDEAATAAERASRPAPTDVFFDRGPGYARLSGGAGARGGRRPVSAADLLALHHGPGFVLPNAWDAGSARILEQVGFPAIATTSAGIAWSLGVPDGGALDLDTMLEHVGRHRGRGRRPGHRRPGVRLRRRRRRPSGAPSRSGAVGGNLEDQVGGVLFGIDEAADRIAAARAAAPAGTFVLNARTDTCFGGATGDVFDETVERAEPLRRGRRRLRLRARRRRGGRRPARSPRPIPAPLNLVAGLASLTDAHHVDLVGSHAGQPRRQPDPRGLQLPRAGRPGAAGDAAPSASSTEPCRTPTCRGASTGDHATAAGRAARPRAAPRGRLVPADLGIPGVGHPARRPGPADRHADPLPAAGR